MKKKIVLNKKANVKDTIHSVNILENNEIAIEGIGWRDYFLTPLMLVAATFATYYRSLSYAFQFDDIPNIEKYFNIRSNTFWDLCFANSRWISYWLNALYYQIGRFDPWYYRMGNVAIHTINGLLVYAILFMLLRRQKKDSFFCMYAYQIALCTALLFLLHPVQTQTVSYVIQGQLEGMATCALLLMTWLFLRRNYTVDALERYGYTGLLCIGSLLACGTKEIAIISPLFLLLVDWFFVAHEQWYSLKKRLWLHGIITLNMIIAYVYFLKPSFFLSILTLQSTANNNLGNIITARPGETITPFYYFISEFKVIVHYIAMFIWPFNISVEYDWKLATSPLGLDVLVPLGVLVATAYGLYRLYFTSYGKLLVFGASWFFIYIAPRSTIIPSPELIVDYKTYGASCGILLLLAVACVWGVVRIGQIMTRINPAVVQGICAVALVLVLSYGTMERNTVWRSGKEFWHDVMCKAPQKARGYNNYGVELSYLDQYAESIPFYQKAIQLDAHYSDPLNNLAIAYSKIGQIDKAIDTLRMALTLNQGYPEGYNNLASFYIQKKEYEKAEEALKIAVTIRPYYGKAYFNLGRICLDRGNSEMAWEYFKKACTEADLDNEFGYDAYAQASIHVKKYDHAIIAYQKVLQCNPNNRNARFNIGTICAATEQYDKAIATFQELVSLWPEDHDAWNALARVYVTKSDYAHAAVCFEKIFPHYTHDQQIYLKRAECYERMGKLDQAIAVLTQLEKANLNPQSTALAHTLINALHEGQHRKT